MSAQGGDDRISNRTVPRITIGGESDYRDDSAEGSDTDTTYDDFLSPERLSETEDSDSLEKQLWRTAVRHANGVTPSFWPPSVWETIVTKDAVTDKIMQCFPDYGRKKAEVIAARVWRNKSGKWVRVFTILALLDQVKDLLKHILSCPHGIRDHDLPLTLKGRKGVNRSTPWELCRADSDAVCCFSRLSASNLEQFALFQRRLAVPVFRMDGNSLIHLDLDDKDILPWCEEAEVPPVNAMSGGYGTVIRVKIHPECHEFHKTLRAVCYFLS